MGFIGGAKPKVQAPVQVPTKKESAEDINTSAEEDKQRRALQAGRASTMLSRGRGILGDDSGAGTKALLS